jgi:glycerophosphoryl diester phosphodiesterase
MERHRGASWVRLAVVVACLGGGAAAADDSPAWNVRDHVPRDRFVIQSHRGAGELEAENTLEAFELAWKLGTVPEADLRVTKDGVIVAFHDNDFTRLVKGVAPGLARKGVKDLTWDELRALDVGSWKGEKFAGRRVPRMADVFRGMTDKPERRLYLDIKEMDLKELAGEVNAARVGSQVIVASSKHPVIKEWKALVPESGTLLWMGGTEAALEKRLAALRKAKFAGITQLQIHVRTKPAGGGEELTPSPAFLAATGRELREHGILFQTLPWGSTDPKLYWRLLDLGAASFATDHPTVTLDAVRKYYEKKAAPRP